MWGKCIYSNHLFLLFMGVGEIHQHSASFLKDLEPGSLTPAPCSHSTAMFSWYIKKDLLGSPWSEHFQSGEAGEVGKPVMVRKVTSSISIVVALNSLRELDSFVFYCWVHSVSTLLWFLVSVFICGKQWHSDSPHIFNNYHLKVLCNEEGSENTSFFTWRGFSVLFLIAWRIILEKKYLL